MNNPAMQWLKSNVVIVLFAAVILAAFIVLPMVASNVGREAERKLSSRKALDTEMTRLQTTAIELNDPTPFAQPPDRTAALINPQTLREFSEYAETKEREADQVVSLAIAFNSKNRGVLMPTLFPSPRASDLPVLADEFSNRLRAAYESLLQDLNAGKPPTLEEMRGALMRQQNQFIRVELNKESMDQLSSAERERLREDLGGRRLMLARERAMVLDVYATIDAFRPPSWTYGQGTEPGADELFEWQWDFWAIHDICMALKRAAAEADNVIESPVKRILSVGLATGDPRGQQRDRRRPPSGPTSPPPGQPGGPFISGGGAGMGAGGSGADPGTPQRPPGDGMSGDPDQPTGQPVDPTQPITPDYSKSFTGRNTNPLFDVRTYRLHIIAETARVPEIVDAMAQQNFMTVVGLEMWPADPYVDLQSGYVYGSEPTSEVVLDIETIWLRQWTKEFMPEATRAALNIAPDQPVGQPITQ